MAEYDVVVIGAGLGGLTAGAILAREGRKVLVIERSNSVGGAASSYKSGDLFVEGSLHETSDPHDPRDPKHDPLTRAGVCACAVRRMTSGAPDFWASSSRQTVYPSAPGMDTSSTQRSGMDSRARRSASRPSVARTTR